MRPVILVVEDEPALREILSDMLERFDYDARLAGTAADAYALAAAERPNAILLDINLPDATGTARETLTRGAFDYVFKPFDMDRIGQVLEAALDSRPR